MVTFPRGVHTFRILSGAFLMKEEHTGENLQFAQKSRFHLRKCCYSPTQVDFSSRSLYTFLTIFVQSGCKDAHS